jgi:hypothetical protein
MTQLGGALRVGAPPPSPASCASPATPTPAKSPSTPTNAWRGAARIYVPTRHASKLARKRNSLARALKTPVDPSVLDEAQRHTL